MFVRVRASVRAFRRDKCTPYYQTPMGMIGHKQTRARTDNKYAQTRVSVTNKVRPLCLLNLSMLEAHFCVCLCSKQGIGGREAPMKATKPWNNRRFIGTFDVENTTKGDSGRYRCIVHSDKGVGVSNYGELTIKREYWSQNRERNTNGTYPNGTAQTMGMFSIRMTSVHTAKSSGDKQEMLQMSSKAMLKILPFYVDLLSRGL